MQERLSNMREALRLKHRSYSKNRFFAERRQKIIQELDKSKQSTDQVSISLEELRTMLNHTSPEFDKLSLIVGNPSNGDLFRVYMPQVITQIVNNSKSLPAWTLLGNICSTNTLDRLHITSRLISACKQFFSECNSTVVAKTMLWVLAGLASLCEGTNYELFRSGFSAENLEKLENMVGFCDQFVEFLAALRGVDERMVRRAVEARLKPEEDQRVLEGLIQIVQKTIGEETTEGFLIFTINIAEGVLSSKFPRRVKALITQLIGSAASMNRSIVIDYIQRSVLFQQLLTRSKIDSHQMKMTVINVLSTILIVSNQAQAQKFIDGGFPQVLVRSLGYPSPDILFQVLKAVCKLLLLDRKPLLQQFRVEQALNKLQLHQNKSIYQLVEQMIDEFFNEEFEN